MNLRQFTSFNKKQRDKILDGLMGLAYSFAAISGGISVYEHNYYGFIRATLSLFAMIIIAKLYKED